MIRLLKITTLLACCYLLLMPHTAQAAEVVVTIKNIKSTKGNIRLGIFTSEEGFSKNKAYKMTNYSKQQLNNGMLTIRISLPAGEYGISLMDDENKNEEMDYNILHIPKEGFGFSDYYHTSLTMPKYNNFKFKVGEDAPKAVVVKMRYM